MMMVENNFACRKIGKASFLITPCTPKLFSRIIDTSGTLFVERSSLW